MSKSGNSGSRIAEHLIEIGAVTFSLEKPYTWASGLRSPIYCDNRATLAYPDIRNEIAEGFAQIIDQEGSVDAIVGVATGAIAHAAFVAKQTGMPMGYVRSKAKEHGRENRIEGFVRPEARVVVIEDLISTGRSSLSAVAGVREVGMSVVKVAAIFTYGFPFAHASFDEAGVPLETLLGLDDLLSVAIRMRLLDERQRTVLDEWRRDPKAWSEERAE